MATPISSPATYSGKKFTVGDTIYFSKFGTRVDSGYASSSGKYGTCYAKLSEVYSSSYAFPLRITGKITTPNDGTFTGCTVKPADVSKGYQVKVTYSHNGGSGTSSQTGYVGKSLTGTSTRTGYDLAGWYTAASGGSKVTTIPTTAKTYYAHWTAHTYYVVFYGNGATGGSTAKETFSYGTAKALTANGFTRTGYTFAGWATSASGAKVYNNKQSVSNLTSTKDGTVNLYAKWTANTYKVHFDGNGDDVHTMNDQTFSYGTATALTASGFDRGNSYGFLGWSTNKDATVPTYTNSQSVINLTATNNGIVTLYAIWKQLYIRPVLNITKCLRYGPDPDHAGDYIEDDVGKNLHLEFDWSVFTNIDENNKPLDISVYYKKDSEPDTSYLLVYNESVYSAVQNPDPSDNPSEEGWYELIDGEYILSEDTEVASGKTYYVRTIGTIPAQGSRNITDDVEILDTDSTYTIKVTLSDLSGEELEIEAPQVQINDYISTAFFTLDFSNGDSTANPPIPGGYGIGIGSPAPTEGLRIGMDTEIVGRLESENLPGIIKMFAGTFAPTGWLLCNGAEVAVADYPFLYDVIGDTYGTPSDSDHFILPDFRGRTPVGSGIGTASDATNHALGQTSGSETHTLTVDQMPSHTHIQNKHTHTSNYNLNLSNGSGSARAYLMADNRIQALYKINDATPTNQNTGGSQSHPNMQPYTVVNYIISTGKTSRWADSAGLPIVRDVTVNGQSVVNNEIASIPTGAVYTAAWTATSNPGDYSTGLTNPVTVPSGTYLIIITIPHVSSTNGIASVRYGDPASITAPLSILYSNGVNCVSKSYVDTFASETIMRATAGTTGACTYSTLERGGLTAIRIA